VGAYGIDANGTDQVGTRTDNLVATRYVSGVSQYLSLQPGVVALVEVGAFYCALDLSALILPSGPSLVLPNGAFTEPFAAAHSPFSASHRFDDSAIVGVQLGIHF
jgi:hypothetical protein